MAIPYLGLSASDDNFWYFSKFPIRQESSGDRFIPGPGHPENLVGHLHCTGPASLPGNIKYGELIAATYFTDWALVIWGKGPPESKSNVDIFEVCLAVAFL